MNEFANRSDNGTSRISAGRQAIVTGMVSAFSLGVVLILANPPDAHVLLFIGGWRDGLFGVAMAALVPLTVVFQIGLGAFFARISRRPAALEEPWLLWLSGSAVMSLVGVAVATAGLINSWLCGGLFALGVAYAVGSQDLAATSLQLVGWCRLRDVAVQKPAFVAVRLGIAAALLLIVLRASTGELNDTDVVQFYWGWLNEVRHLGGIWLSPELPLIQDFTAGRGNGNYLFAAGLAPGLVSHVVSAVFCVMFAVGLRTLVLRTAAISPAVAKPLARLAADLSCLAALWMLPGAMAFGKYHLQFAAWALGFMLVCLQIVTDDDTAWQNRRVMLMPVAIAIPVGLAQFEAFVSLILLADVIVAPERWRALVRLFPLLLTGCVCAGLSLLANWLYLGIPDLNPFPLFENFIFERRFDLWTSQLQQHYLNYIAGGVLTLNAGGDVSHWRELRSLVSAIVLNLKPIVAALAGLLGVAIIANLPALRRRPRSVLQLLLGALLGYALYRSWLSMAFYDLALSPPISRLALFGSAVVGYLAAVRPFRGNAAARSFELGLLGYWLICSTFVVVFHSGSMDRLMRHADVVFVALLLVALVRVFDRASSRVVGPPLASWTQRLRLRRSAAVPLLLAVAMAFSLRAAASAWEADPPAHLLASTLGLQGRAFGLTHPMAQFGRCEEIAGSVPANARTLFLNAYTAMAYCNNAVLLPRTMIVEPHESDYARDLAVSGFADADTVEQTLRRLHINYFLVLKGDSEFWSSGLSAPFRPEKLSSRFDLLEETPSFYVLTWRGAGRPLPAVAAARISEWRRIGIQQHGFMAQNEFVSQWRAMANLGADRPRYAFGGRLDFTDKGWSALYADHGWYAAEPHGTWTVGPVAVLTLPLARSSPAALRVTMDVMPFVIPQLPARTVHVKLGTTEVATWTFRLGDGDQTREIDLPAGAAASGEIALTFEIENSISQYALGLNPDWRPLGVAVRSLVIESAAAAK